MEGTPKCLFTVTGLKCFPWVVLIQKFFLFLFLLGILVVLLKKPPKSGL